MPFWIYLSIEQKDTTLIGDKERTFMKIDKDFIQLVVCAGEKNGKTYLFKAPYDAEIHEDEYAVCDTEQGEKWLKVIGRMPAYIGCDAYKTLMKLTGAHEPLREVKGKVFEVRWNGN